MIQRYSREPMSQIWEDRNRFLFWLKVETAVCQELAKNKKIPLKEWKVLKPKLQGLIKKGGVDPRRVHHFEKTTNHDVIAFTTAVAEKVGPTSRYVHFGLTSSDVVDTALSMMLQEAGKILLDDVSELLAVLKKQAQRYKKLPAMGRTHGMSAEPFAFGLKFLGWYCEWKRNQHRLKTSLENLRYGKLSGAVGGNAHWAPSFEKKILKSLGLKREPVSTQVIPRDRHAEFLNSLAICGASLERMSVELRHLQRTEVGEVQEGFRKGQKGSSAMPHKKNPISSENLTGCARLLRSYAAAAMENIALWHERDISHSSVERVILPDATILLDYAIQRAKGVVKNLVIKKDRVQANLKAAGEAVYSGHFLLALADAGASREDAYYWVQECAHQSLEGKGAMVDLLSAHPKVKKFLKPSQIKKLGSVDYQLRNTPAIYKEALNGKAL